MTFIIEIEMSRSDVIALLALLVAGLSALYARWSWNEAKKANQISLLHHKKEIYDAFFNLKMHMQQQSEFADMGEVSKFYYPSKNAKIYLPTELSSKIDNYFDACFWIADIHRKNNGITSESGLECAHHKVTERELAPKIENELIALLKMAQT